MQWDESEDSDGNSITNNDVVDLNYKQDISFAAGDNQDAAILTFQNRQPVPEAESEDDDSMGDIDDVQGPAKNNLRMSKDFKIPDPAGLGGGSYLLNSNVRSG